MAFQLSPGVDVKEIDLTAIIPAVSTTKAGFAGLFNWGPLEQRITVTSENELVERFSTPDNTNYPHWFTAANYLGYSNNLQVVRVVDQDVALNATTARLQTGGVLVKNSEHFEEVDSALVAIQHEFVAKYPGTLGNSLSVSVSDNTDVALNPIIAYPTSDVGGVLDSDNAPTTSTTSFGFIKSSDIFAPDSGTSTREDSGGLDKLRFKRGNPQNITGVTNAFSLGFIQEGDGTAPVGAGSGLTLGSNGAAGGITLPVSDMSGTVATGDYVALTKNNNINIAKITSYVDHGTTGEITLGTDGFGVGLTLSLAEATDELTVLGQVTTGATFANATGMTAASVLWKYHNEFNTKLPATSSSVEAHGASFDLLHAIVVDAKGDWTGTKGTVLERFEGLSKAKNAKRENGTSIYYKDFINANSKYVWSADAPTNGGNGLPDVSSGAYAFGDNSTSVGGTFSELTGNYYEDLNFGADGATSANDFYSNGYDLFADSETVDISLILGGPQEGIQAKQLVDLVTDRKDAVAFLSPAKTAVVNSSGNASKSAAIATANVSAYRQGLNGSDAGGDVDFSDDNLNVSSSYAVLDSGYKYMYDRYNDVFRFVPLNGDIAGIAVRSDNETETWFSPAGFNRGQVRGVVKLAYNPLKAQRDELYINGINPVVSFPGEGTVLFGDKTMQSKPSAFDRINVRRLFIVLEKAIATAAKFQLFEQNDAFTRASFRQLIEPFLREVQSRRGVIDFKVVCDESNNTGEVIDRNEFVADIFIKPTRSINFITLNFIATRTGINFDEIGGSSS